MLKAKVIGIGQCGNKAVIDLIENGIIGPNDVLLMNTTLKDIPEKYRELAMLIEGTEGCKGYKDYMYHFKGFLIGCVYSAIMALIISGIDYLILRFIVW